MKIQEAIGDMPPELQALFSDVFKESDPVSECRKNESEIQKELMLADIQMGRAQDEPDMRFYDESVDDAMWERTQQDIFDSYNQRNSNESNQFNIEDWI